MVVLTKEQQHDAANKGLWLPQLERDNCGVGFVCSIKGVTSSKIMSDAQMMLERMAHRGACGCDNDNKRTVPSVADLRLQLSTLYDTKVLNTGAALWSFPNSTMLQRRHKMYKRMVHDLGAFDNCSEDEHSSWPMMSTKTKAVVKFSYDPRLEDELGLAKGEFVYVVEKSTDGWWKGENPNGGVGWFPSNYVEVVNSNGNVRIENRSPAPISVPMPPKSQLATVIALYSFDASSSEELSFRKGERLDIVDHPSHDSDWWMARNRHGTIGLVPRIYIEVIHEEALRDIDPPPFCWKEVPIEHKPWFFGIVTRDKLQSFLDQGREGEFIFRESESNPGDLSISMQLTDNGQLKYGGSTFNNINELLTHYTTNPSSY